MAGNSAPASRSPARTAIQDTQADRGLRGGFSTSPRFMRSTGTWPASPPMTRAFFQFRLIFGDRCYLHALAGMDAAHSSGRAESLPGCFMGDASASFDMTAKTG